MAKIMKVDDNFYEYCKRRKGKGRSMISITRDLIPTRVQRPFKHRGKFDIDFL